MPYKPLIETPYKHLGDKHDLAMENKLYQILGKYYYKYQTTPYFSPEFPEVENKLNLIKEQVISIMKELQDERI